MDDLRAPKRVLGSVWGSRPTRLNEHTRHTRCLTPVLAHPKSGDRVRFPQKHELCGGQVDT